MGARTKFRRNLNRLFHIKSVDEKEQDPLEYNNTSSPPATDPPPPRRPLGFRRLTDRVAGLHRRIWRKKTRVPVCGCGRPLKAGWECSVCRLSCPRCHRALMEREECSRCLAAVLAQEQEDEEHQQQQSHLSTEM